ncbi:hypothetical protein CAPTEDRAFT_212458 [Capitella teleta]|uniref:Uncharacterized protein n=1 Tax=Capitella teleta TaxID=283909 RepID=R7UGA9_CAPTE|nr:hypothetical protein CAPTEDRAFT_212458 [Capitella teleta]|eukprot:ELU02838.1 hypothetical protein CAPTEDRAFT_212458 [Capitella teleta]
MDQRHREVTLAMDMPVLNPTAITNHTMQTAKSHYFTEDSIPSAVNTLTAFIIFARDFESKCIEHVTQSNVVEDSPQGNAGVEESSGSESTEPSDKEIQQQFDDALRSVYPVKRGWTWTSTERRCNSTAMTTEEDAEEEVLQSKNEDDSVDCTF